jgi:hypothetical protein
MKRKGLAEDIHEIGATNNGDLKQTEIMFPRFYAKKLNFSNITIILRPD